MATKTSQRISNQYSVEDQKILFNPKVEIKDAFAVPYIDILKISDSATKLPKLVNCKRSVVINDLPKRKALHPSLLSLSNLKVSSTL